MKRIFLYFFILLSTLKLNAQQLMFSDSTIVSLITCSAGEEVYEKFGHTAIRLKNPHSAIDVVFNYGIFSFETPDFYYKFIKGETDYELGVYDTGNFLACYAQRNSLVWEQILNLNSNEKRVLIKNLLRNYEPENRVYRYNFVFDNCSTRPRDKILGSIHGYVKFEDNSDVKTYRQWIGSYVGNDTWLKFGIDLLFGKDADQSPTFSESMFLPEVLMTGFQTAEIHSLNNQNRKLVLDKKLLIDKKEVEQKLSIFSIKPLTLTLILFIIGLLITIWDLFRNHHYKLFDSVLLISTGIGGLLVAYMMIFSSHPLVKSNLNILWLNPLNILLGIFMWFPKLRTPIFFYEIINILLLIGGLFSFALSTQIFNLAAFPLIVLLLLRSTSWFVYLKKRMYKRRSVL
ncbi:MAG: DUF4105 domain-containing protein [Paludibacter sp.]|jgi:Domain of unknown function (DUF4105)